jgi:hypothetical protein
VKREAERKQAIASGLVDDPDKPRSLSEAIHFVGTCQTMCPEFEMHQREFQNNVEKWEIVLDCEKDRLILRIPRLAGLIYQEPSRRFIDQQPATSSLFLRTYGHLLS